MPPFLRCNKAKNYLPRPSKILNWSALGTTSLPSLFLQHHTNWVSLLQTLSLKRHLSFKIVCFYVIHEIWWNSKTSCCCFQISCLNGWHNLPPGWNRVTIAAKRWLGTSTGMESEKKIHGLKTEMPLNSCVSPGNWVPLLMRLKDSLLHWQVWNDWHLQVLMSISLFSLPSDKVENCRKNSKLK